MQELHWPYLWSNGTANKSTHHLSDSLHRHTSGLSESYSQKRWSMDRYVLILGPEMQVHGRIHPIIKSSRSSSRTILSMPWTGLSHFWTQFPIHENRCIPRNKTHLCHEKIHRFSRNASSSVSETNSVLNTFHFWNDCVVLDIRVEKLR